MASYSTEDPDSLFLDQQLVKSSVDHDEKRRKLLLTSEYNSLFPLPFFPLINRTEEESKVITLSLYNQATFCFSCVLIYIHWSIHDMFWLTSRRVDQATKRFLFTVCCFSMSLAIMLSIAIGVVLMVPSELSKFHEKYVVWLLKIISSSNAVILLFQNVYAQVNIIKVHLSSFF